MIFAGVTVAISITGLAVIGIDFITKLGIGSALGVLTAVLLANSLLPAVLSLLGHKIDRGRLGMKPIDESREGQSRTLVAAWGRFVSRNAKIVLPVVIVVLLLLASPVLAVRLGLADAGTAPKDQTTRKAYDLLSEGFGPGFTVADPGGGGHARRPPVGREDRSSAREGARRRAGQQADLQREDAGAGVGRDHQHLLEVQAAGREDRRHRLDLPRHHHPRRARRDRRRAPTCPARTPPSPTSATRSSAARPWFLLYIIGVTFLVLAMAFRSVVIAIKAALTTLMSALVGFGMLTLVVQLGHGMGFIGLDRTGPIESFVPPIAFAILFGLSMDYEVFLMSRIREEHVHGSDTVTAVKDGISGVGRVIVAAALIMSSVFFSFLLSPDRVSKEFGLLLGIAILTDALLMRMTLVPALLTVLGERSWAMPAWFDRILPNVTIESPGEREVPVVEREPVEVGAG